jgi:hypothetical protein
MHNFSASVHAKFFAHILNMKFNGRFGDEERSGNLLIAQAL